VALVVVGVLFLLIGCIREVSTKNVGIETTFGKPTGELANGIHFTWPWVNVTEMDAAIQTNVYSQAGGNCLDARVAFQIEVCVDTSIQWRIDAKEADYLFQNYRDFNNVQILVERHLNNALNTVLADYDPLSVTSTGASTQSSLNSLASQVQTVLTADIGTQVHVLAVFITVIHYNSQVQGYIDQDQQQVAKTRIAQQAELTNAAQAKANSELSQSVSNPQVNINQCLTTVNNAVNQGEQGVLPAGYNCDLTGGGSSIVVPASK
jgi:SPFH domain / Band 7 family